MEISICLTSLQGFSLTTNVDIYSNADGFTTPVYTNVPVSSLYGANCTFTATVPSGSTIIQIIDPIGGCDSFINIQSSDFCDNCNLRFSVFSSTTICRIVAGLLIDDCSGTTITDYIIDWYGPNSTTNIAYTSGYGNAFLGYNYTHPLENNTAIVAAPGVYFPQIRKIKINGLVFTQTGGTGSYLADLNSCLSGVTSQVSVSEYTCTNGSSSKSQYTHEVHFTALANGAPPAPSTATIDLSSTTQYFAWAFRAQQVPDRLDFIFSGSSYSEPILLESLYTGQGGNIYNLNNTFSATTVTKSGGTQFQRYIPKVTVLTGLTINNGDKIILVVTPNTQNPQTNWDLFFNACLTTFDCTNCLFDNQPNYLISGGTPIVTGPDNCGKYNFGYTMSGCNNTFLSTDFYNYIFFSDYLNAQPEIFFHSPQTKYRLDIGPTSYFTPTSFTPQLSVANFQPILFECFIGCYNDNATFPNLCINPPNTNYIRYTKFNTGLGGTGIFKMYFSDISDASFYWSKIQIVRNALFLSTPVYSLSSTDFGFYKEFSIRIPGGTAVGDTPCGDGNIPIEFHFHLSSVVTSGFTGGYYEIELTMPTIPNDIPINSCDNCRDSAQNICDRVNNSSTGFTIDITSNTGSRYVYIYDACELRFQTTYDYEDVHEAYLSIPKYFNNTYMYSGTPYSYLPSLTTELCDYTNEMTLKRLTSFPVSSDNFYWERILFKYHIYILNQLKYFARLNTDGSLDPLPNYEFGPDSSASPTFGTIEQPGNQYILYGQYISSYNFTQVSGIIRIDFNGILDPTFQTNIGSGFDPILDVANIEIKTHAVQSDGKILLGGIGFSGYNGNIVNNLVRINPDGTYDPTFNVSFGISNPNISNVIVQPFDQQILVVGNFSQVNGDITKKYLVRLNTNGSVDNTFNTNNMLNIPTVIQLQSDGKVLVGSTQGSVFYLHRRNTDGSLDTTFNTNLGLGFNSTVLAIEIQPIDNKILVGGNFTSFNGDTTKRYLVRLNQDGTIDNTFNLGSGFIGVTTIWTIKVDTFGGIYVGGQFSNFNFQPFNNIIKLTSLGTIDTTFNSGIGFTGYVSKIDLDSNNKLIINGDFVSYNNYPNNFYDFGIYTYSLDKGEYIEPAFPIYKYSGGTITYSDPTYII